MNGVGPSQKGAGEQDSEHLHPLESFVSSLPDCPGSPFCNNFSNFNYLVRVCLVFKTLMNCLAVWLYHFAFSRAMNESSSRSVSLTVNALSILEFGHSNKCMRWFAGVQLQQPGINLKR